MADEIKIIGLDQLQQRLVAMSKDVANKVLREGLQGGALEILTQMQENAPKRTGFLAEHFNTRTRIQGDNIAGTAFVGPAGKMYYPDRGDKAKGTATGKYPHKGGLVPVASVARFQEFGTSRMAAHPFMRQAFETKKQAALDRIIVSIIDGIARWTK